jgi:hypothetical protein
LTGRDLVKLLFGPYKLPALRRGDRAFCLYRDCQVVVTSWTDARISWPRCRALDCHRGGAGLLVEEELARAVRHESAAAICYWWGVSEWAVWRWRKALEVTRGSQHLIHAAADLGAEAMSARGLTPEEIEQRRQQALEKNLAQHFQKAYREDRWTEEEMVLLGTLEDAEVARQTGRTTDGVRQKREKLGIPNPSKSSRVGPRPRWTVEEDELALSLPAEETARRTGRMVHAVANRRHLLAVRFQGG